MKNFFVIYIGIGSLFGIPMSLSYIYAEWFVIINLGWQIFSIHGLLAILFLCWYIFIAPIIRSFIWLPSLIIWFYTDGGQNYSFFKWLAPGFYIDIVGY